MVIPIEAISKEDFERQERGLPPLPKKKIERPEPIPPKVENQIMFENITIDKLVRIQAVKKRVLKNADGISFIGFDCVLEIKDGKPLAGWFLEGDIQRLKKLPVIAENTDARLLQSIGWY